MSKTPNINTLLRQNPRKGLRYGAPMGHADLTDGGLDNLYLQKIRFVDGDYSADGTYWGNNGVPIYCAFTPCLGTMLFVRAMNREYAKSILAESFGELTYKA